MEERAKELEAAARDLLDALDRLHGRGSLSTNVCAARDALRRLVPEQLDAGDRYREKVEE